MGRRHTIRVGALGPVRFEPGEYLYVGSAKRNLAQRIARHRRRRKRLRWHIDYLLQRGVVRDVHVESWKPGAECALVRRALRSGRATPGPNGFGSSDCRCKSHLMRLSEGAGDEWRSEVFGA